MIFMEGELAQVFYSVQLVFFLCGSYCFTAELYQTMGPLLWGLLFVVREGNCRLCAAAKGVSGESKGGETGGAAH